MHPEPPRGLKAIRPGMSVAEAKKILPDLREGKQGVRDELVLDSGASDIRLELRLDSGVVASIRAVITGHTAPDTLSKAWGEPQIGRDALGQHEKAWVSDRTGWKAKLDCLEANCNLDFIPYHELTTDLFGSHVVPPGDLAKLRIGMTIADARKYAPGVVGLPNGLPAGFENVREYVAIDDKLGTVRAIYLNLPQFTERVIEEAWGPGAPATKLGSKDVLVWHDPATRWRGTLEGSMGYTHDLYFDNYIPAAQLLGDQPERLDGLPEPLLGRTVDEVKASYKADVSMQGKDLVLVLPPTEWEHSATRFTLDLAGGKVKQINFSMSWKAHPEARDTLLELFTKKWGEPHRLEEGDGKPWALIFRDEDPRVEIREDLDRDAWRLELR